MDVEVLGSWCVGRERESDFYGLEQQVRVSIVGTCAWRVGQFLTVVICRAGAWWAMLVRTLKELGPESLQWRVTLRTGPGEKWRTCYVTDRCERWRNDFTSNRARLQCGLP